MRHTCSDCCARAANGQATTDPAITLMNSRRRVTAPKAQEHADNSLITSGICDRRNGVQGSVCTATIQSRSCLLWVKSRQLHEVRTMSALPPKADMDQQGCDVRFVPKAVVSRCSKRRCYSTTSSARPSSEIGRVMPSALAVLRLRTNSTFVDCWTGKSAGFSPFRIRPA
jgi:hypothetical protein